MDFHQICRKLYFIAYGFVDLEIIDKHGDVHVLDTLEQGDLIGQYSVLYENFLVFRVVAKSTSVKILALDGQKFFMDLGDTDKIAGLKSAIELAE